MGPDPDDYNPGSFPPPYEHPPHPFPDDVLMSDIDSQSLHQPPYPTTTTSSSSSLHHHHTLYHYHHHFSAHPPHTGLSLVQPAASEYPSYGAPSNQYTWPMSEHELASLNNDEGSSHSEFHQVLDTMFAPQNMYEDAAQDEPQTTTSAYMDQFPHHQPLPQPEVPSQQHISLDAGSWPTTVPSPGPVPSVPPLPGHLVNPTGTVSQQLQQQMQDMHTYQATQVGDSDEETPEDGGEEPAFATSLPLQPHMLGLSHANPNTLGPENPQLFLFLRRWIYSSRVHPPPILSEVNAQADQPERVVHFGNLEGDRCDIQGINWRGMGTTRRDARLQRLATYNNYVNRAKSDCWKPRYEMPSDAEFFRFRRMDIKHNVHLAHFQLRNDLSCVSRSLAFYPSKRSVQQINPVSGKSTVALDLQKYPNIQISTLSAKHGALVVGGFTGDYYVKSLDSIYEQEPGYHEGQLTVNTSGITNHVQLYQPRSSDRPIASFASNDSGFRTLDITTNKIISETAFDLPVNCSAISPDRRLRVLVGDHNDVLICNSETNEVLQKLRSHKDFGFSCDWSENGWSVATGFQDMMVKIWDARKWTDSNGEAAPVTTIKTNMAGARSLRFSPLGSGRPVLVAAEEADYVNIIDAQTFSRRQVLDMFGEIGGVDFVNDGRDLMLLCCDRRRGGLLRLERTRQTLTNLYDDDSEPRLSIQEFERDVERNLERRNRTIYSRRRLRAACPANMDLF